MALNTWVIFVATGALQLAEKVRGGGIASSCNKQVMP